MLSGEKLRRARKDLNLSQRDLGEMIGVSGTLIGHYENGLRSPRGTTLQKLAEALGVDPDWLTMQDGDDIRDNYMLRFNSVLQLAGLFADPEHGRGFLKAYSQLCWNLNELQRAVDENQIDDDAEPPEADGDELENLRRIETFAQNCCWSYAVLREKVPAGMLAEKENFSQWRKERAEFDFLLGEYLKMNGRGRAICRKVIENLLSKAEYTGGDREQCDLWTVGKRFKEVREEQGRSLQEVSAQSKIEESRIQEIERGQGTAATAKEISHICFALDLPISGVLPFEAEEAERLNKFYDSTQAVLENGPNVSPEYYDSVCGIVLAQWENAAQELISRIGKRDDENMREQLRILGTNGSDKTL